MSKLIATASPLCTDTPTWQECEITLARGRRVVAAFKVYRHRDNPHDRHPVGIQCFEWSRWHVVTTGREFDSLDAACAALPAMWEHKPTAEERWRERRAAVVYAEGYAYACGYQD